MEKQGKIRKKNSVLFFSTTSTIVFNERIIFFSHNKLAAAKFQRAS